MRNDDTPQSTESTDNYRAETGDRDETPATKSQSTWTDNGSSQSRRKLLKQVGAIGALSIGGFSGVTAAQRENIKKLDTDFNPQDETHVKRSIEILRTKSETKRRELVNQLSPPQQQAIAKGTMPAQQTIKRIDTQPQTSDDTLKAQASTASAQFEVASYSLFGNLLWKFYHKVIWNHVPTSPKNPGEVYNITSRAYPYVNDPFWSYDGIASKSLRDYGGYFTAYKQGAFSNGVGDFGTSSYPFITVSGFPDGVAIVDDSSCDC